MRERTFLQKLRVFMIFAGPATFAFITVMVIPMLYGIALTFTDWNGISNTMSFVGLANYAKVFTDSAFWESMWLTCYYSFVSVVLINVLAFFIAFFLTSGIFGEKFLRVGIFTPNLVGGVILGYIWNFIFTRALVSLGKALDVAILSKSWLSDPDLAMWMLIIVTAWRLSGYMMIIYVAGFMGISKEVMESASIDGCNGWQKMRYVTMPLMASSFTICLFLSLQNCFKVYDINLSLTNGDPYNSTQLVSMHIFRKAFLSHDYGAGQAEAFIFFILVAILTVVQIYITKSREVDA